MTQDTFYREISKTWKVEKNPAGLNHHVGMVLPPGNWAEFDPFLMLAEDWFKRGVFAVHPHRGQETVTYVIEGNLEHYDNKAGGGALGPGDVQWMTAGRGVVHKEDPAVGETVHSLQLWLNLPKANKMADPRYQNLRGQDMPVRVENGATVRVFSGNSGSVHAKTENYVPVTMVELTLEPGATFVQDVPSDYNGFIYVLDGSGTFGSNELEGQKAQVLWLGSAEGHPNSAVEIRASEGANPLKALLYAGRPVHEPVVQYGPFVMNTKEEIAEAIRDYQSGKFEA